MTNKPMFSVERELLEEMMAAMKETYVLPAKYYGSTLGDRVRSILESQNEQADPPAIGTLHRDCDERIIFESSGEIHIKDGMQVYAKPAAQHQGVPVAYRVVFNDGEKSKWEDGMPQSQDLYDVRDGVIRGVERAYAEQPAPVAILLPDRMVKTDRSSDEYDMCADAHNDCLDAVARLNGVKP